MAFETTGDQHLKDMRASMQAWWQENSEPVFDPAVPKVRLHHPTFGPDEVMAFTQQMLTTHVTMGPKVEAFEQAYCDALGYKIGVSNNSGSSANLLMLAALTTPIYENRLQPGDEVILPALTWSTSLWPVIQRGLVPVFVDSDPLTLNMKPEAIDAAIGPKTRAVMSVPVYGNPCDMDAIEDICKRHSLVHIEDCCESMGATYKGRSVGSFGLVSSFSFYFSHHITTLEGGICLTEDEDLADVMRIVRAHGWIRGVKNIDKWAAEGPNYDKRFTFVGEGYNLRLTEPQAAMGLVQIDKLSGFVKARRSNAAYLKSRFAEYADALTPQVETEGAEHSWFGFPVLVSADAPFSRDEICTFLNSKGVETRPIIAGNLVRHPGTKLYEYRQADALTGADQVMDFGFALPCHQSLTDEALDYMAGQLDAFMAGER
jgi:CDP-6-deoxy-D-xylo-4-hexulose-3-dehydrase